MEEDKRKRATTLAVRSTTWKPYAQHEPECQLAPHSFPPTMPPLVPAAAASDARGAAAPPSPAPALADAIIASKSESSVS